MINYLANEKFEDDDDDFEPEESPKLPPLFVPIPEPLVARSPSLGKLFPWRR